MASNLAPVARYMRVGAKLNFNQLKTVWNSVVISDWMCSTNSGCLQEMTPNEPGEEAS